MTSPETLIRRIRQLVFKGHSDKQIAQFLGINRQAVSYQRKKHGIVAALSRSDDALAKVRTASERAADIEALRGKGGDEAFARLIGARKFEDHPKLRSSRRSPKPLSRPTHYFSGCGGSLMGMS